jgi:uncharacterized protein (DUF1800 family)
MNPSAANSLDPYSPPKGKWSAADAAHLLRRTGFSCTSDELEAAVQAGLEATVDRLLSVQTESDDFEETQRLLRQAADDAEDLERLRGWLLYRLRYSANPLIERMTLFWHNHFATSNVKVKSPAAMALQNDLFRRESLGSFPRLLHAVAKDLAMVRWLDMDQNTRFTPNENFARELMELFCLGIGYYSEVDVKEAARAFTGVAVRQGGVWIDPTRRDDGDKRVLGAHGNLTGDDVIDLCLKQPACSQRLALKLLAAFVAPAPDAPMQTAVAELLRQERFELRATMRRLLTSQMFFSPSIRGALIKSPVELALGAMRALNVQSNFNETSALLSRLGQRLFEPPSVKGWDGGRSWINPSTMLERLNFAGDLVVSQRFGEVKFEFPQTLDDCSERELVDWAAPLLLSRPLDAHETERIVAALQPMADQRKQQRAALLHLLLAAPEFQLS